jgi:hypothetical protein
MNHERLGSPAELAHELFARLPAFAVEDAPIPEGAAAARARRGRVLREHA